MQEAIAFLERVLPARPEAGVVLGSGLGDFGQVLTNRVEIHYEDIPGWPRSTVPGHAGKFLFGSLGGRNVAVLSGRAHFYEGNPMEQVTLGVRVLGRLGIRALVLTNAAGGINTSYERGRLVLISDHINLQGTNPLIGPNDDSLGPRFSDMTEAYSASFRAIAKEEAARLGITLSEGVYAAMTGPSFETPAEIRFLRTIGADLVGMSTAPEVIVARHMSIPVLAISTVTNMAAGMTGEALNHEEVLETGRQVRGHLVALLSAVIPRLVA
jgi:purine-nucleoside phosphorylase